MLTVGELKEWLANAPDDAVVYYQRVEDSYFKDGDWSTIDKHLVFNCFCQFDTNMTAEEKAEHHKEYCHSHYVPAESAYLVEQGTFVINAHY